MYNDHLVYKVVIRAIFRISLWKEKVALSNLTLNVIHKAQGIDEVFNTSDDIKSEEHCLFGIVESLNNLNFRFASLHSEDFLLLFYNLHTHFLDMWWMHCVNLLYRNYT